MLRVGIFVLVNTNYFPNMIALFKIHNAETTSQKKWDPLCSFYWHFFSRYNTTEAFKMSPENLLRMKTLLNQKLQMGPSHLQVEPPCDAGVFSCWRAIHVKKGKKTPLMNQALHQPQLHCTMNSLGLPTNLKFKK